MQSVHFQVFLHRQDQKHGFSRAEGIQALGDFRADLNAGRAVVVPCDWLAVLSTAERLAHQYTESVGHRAMDILHVATALHLGAREFLTFDANQRQLAEAEGLRVPF